MASVFDVSEHILSQTGPISAMKLQKLVYYAQAWSLVWDERPLFDEKIEAWANGPVVPALYQRHRGSFLLEPRSIGGDPAALDERARETIAAVLDFYGDKSPQWLSDLTHLELPWRAARDGIPDGERGSHEIKQDELAEYYGSL
ncbi:MAG: DUF4065 domain-containing protein [Chromatiaceae bacterium]|nr:DUF4065 domain-containing protein [Chromatiaceae bacterium]MCF7993855.1 DUF4065 domain-containing protein [Chromatiaceae bacterium]MCF8003875.1 DUF4065 domain-containing protein [Chromatiaceae bacterium]MCF8017148.1 DUF4065 domain-containing protein [Chromatiaceae bacterium]